MPAGPSSVASQGSGASIDDRACLLIACQLARPPRAPFSRRATCARRARIPPSAIPERISHAAGAAETEANSYGTRSGRTPSGAWSWLVVFLAGIVRRLPALGPGHPAAGAGRGADRAQSEPGQGARHRAQQVTLVERDKKELERQIEELKAQVAAAQTKAEEAATGGAQPRQPHRRPAPAAGGSRARGRRRKLHRRAEKAPAESCGRAPGRAVAGRRPDERPQPVSPATAHPTDVGKRESGASDRDDTHSRRR